ncbi:MAG: peptidyl-tRNA hydrolase Pth2 [Candidatus Aenigmatarchaeota archaeon]|nr:peptidyl-tRNA hydrolase Pth2 [Candidatus Aenigmarchaeota archaeon]
MKQVIVIRTDLKMGKGKLCSQAAHASLAAFLKSDKKKREKWINEGMKKVVVKVSSENEILILKKLAENKKIPSEIIIDKGLTQIEPGTITALGLGPDEDEKIDEITGNLKLL